MSTAKNQSRRPPKYRGWSVYPIEKCSQCGIAWSTCGVKSEYPTTCLKCKQPGQIYLMDRCPCSPDRLKLMWGQPDTEEQVRCKHCRIIAPNDEYDFADVNLGSEKVVCKKCKVNKPKYGKTGVMTLLHCDDCKEPDDVLLKNAKCMCEHSEGQERVRKLWGPNGTKNPLRCKFCKYEDDVDVVNKRCSCEKQNRACWGTQGKPAERCISCKIEGDIYFIQK